MEKVVKISDFFRFKAYYENAFNASITHSVEDSSRNRLMKSINGRRYLEFLYFLKDGTLSPRVLKQKEPQMVFSEFLQYLNQNIQEIIETMSDRSVAEILEKHPELMTSSSSDVFFKILTRLGL